LTALFPC